VKTEIREHESRNEGVETGICGLRVLKKGNKKRPVVGSLLNGGRESISRTNKGATRLRPSSDVNHWRGP